MLKTTALLLAFATFSAYADRPGKIMGIGQTPCGDFVEWRTANNSVAQAQAVDWTFGYISAYNLYGSSPQVPAAPTYATVGLYLEKYCRDRPLDLVVAAATSLIKDLKAK